jgi:mono/diheme cytochrome c family protein
MNRNKHLLLWSSLGVLALLVTAAVQENFLKDWRRIQASVRNESGPIDVRLRQAVVPQLHVTDRCVSCHVGMAAGEQGLEGNPLAAAHKPVGHDPAEFGCTVCHGGQGRATEKADAHGDVHFWPEPMVPHEFAYAGCGTCHFYTGVPNQPELARAQRVVERYDCLACHRIDDRGGTIRPGAGGMEGPGLSRVGVAGFAQDWYAKHLEKSKQSGIAAWKSSFGEIPDADRQAIDTFLATRTGAPSLIEAKTLFHTVGCRGCHKIEGVGGEEGPDLTREGQKDPGQLNFAHVPGKATLANWLTEHTRGPAKIVPGSKMPAFDLSDAELQKLTYYMLSLRRSKVPDAYWPKDRIKVERFKEREFATDGATLFSTFCVACHGPTGQGRRFPGTYPAPAIANSDFQAVATDEFLAETIANGRPGRRMPAWGPGGGGLRPEEVREIVAHLRQLGGAKGPSAQIATAATVPEKVGESATAKRPRRWVKGFAEAGRWLYALECAGCHGKEGEGPEAPALNNKGFLAAADDTYLVETIGRGRHGTPMPSFRQGSPTNRALTPTGIEAIVTYIRTWEGKQP